MKKYIILLLTVISILYLYTSKKEEYIIPSESIRFRVIANSNTIYDQNIKMKVKEKVQNEIYSLIKNEKSIKNTRKILKNNQKEIDKIVKNTLKEENYDENYTIKYGKNPFPTKEYKGKTYKSGDYESLVITLGSGEGNNWWCFIYPGLCFEDSEKTSKNDLEYTSFFKEILNKIINFK